MERSGYQSKNEAHPRFNDPANSAPPLDQRALGPPAEAAVPPIQHLPNHLRVKRTHDRKSPTSPETLPAKYNGSNLGGTGVRAARDLDLCQDRSGFLDVEPTSRLCSDGSLLYYIEGREPTHRLSPAITPF